MPPPSRISRHPIKPAAKRSAPVQRMRAVEPAAAVSVRVRRASPHRNQHPNPNPNPNLNPPLHPTPYALPPATINWHGFSVHVVAAVMAVVAIVAISQGSIRRLTPALTASVTGGKRVEIGLEHFKPVTLSLALTTQISKGVADFSHDALETIAVSLPSSWVRREVKGVALSAVTSDAPTFGFTRWHIPPGALVSFDITPPSAILLHNPSGVPAEIRLTRVNLTTQKAERDVVLVKDGTVELW